MSAALPTCSSVRNDASMVGNGPQPGKQFTAAAQLLIVGSHSYGREILALHRLIFVNYWI